VSTKLFVLVSHKTQPRRYHSHGAACGLKVEIAPAALENPQAFVSAIRRHMELCEIAVEEELKRLATIDAALPTPVTSEIDGQETNGRASNRPAMPAPPSRRFDPPPAIPPPGPAEAWDETEGSTEDEDDEDAPKDGRQLLGWARKQTPDLKAWVISWGYKTKTKGNVVDWPEAKVAQCYAAAKKALAAGTTKKP